MELDITKMTVWKEFFCRYDEGKNQMSNQLQLAEENICKTVSIDQSQKQAQGEVDALIQQLKANQKRIEFIRGQNSEGSVLKFQDLELISQIEAKLK